MTLRYRAWKLISERRCCAADLAIALGVTREAAKTLLRDLRQDGHIVLSHRDGREHYYRVTDKPRVPDRRNGRPGPRGPRKYRPTVGYGSQPCELARVWR